MYLETSETPVGGMSAREMIDPKASMWSWMAFDLWFYRTQRGLSLAQVGLIVKATRGTVSNWEAGRLKPKQDQLKLLDSAWSTGGHFERLAWYARTGHEPDWFRQFLQYEEAASEIRAYHGKTVPVLLQTAGYSQALLWAAGRNREVEAESRARAKRQKILQREDGPYLWILLDQEVLELPVGGPQVMREQLRQMIDVMKNPRFSVRVVTRETGPHPGHDGSFQLYRVGDRRVAYAAAQIGGRLIEDTAEVSTLGIRFDQIGALALSRDASIELIQSAVRKFDDQLA
ncbi:helix-turn-helix domain-containing protein [Actinomadura parmotrematis]|uniref:Helix-turn-helix transcriptional regulator n=1 Tax=Actinomadura parmotrematis TaxID=2864039 RepID=A0ABS7FLZ5_9ACTN|nr:helix-turn-helix transcriptional regulator [Actinomadura parmotrematis]MBW8481400.1 helix-turn-helix transcriptional regulator [Actinomadura parmotrematis]